MTSFLRAGRSRPVALWLFAVAALVLVMVVVGGATRLTDSGLSITQWRPVTGAIPPLNDASWQAEFARYRQIPQYRALNPGMSLSDFQTIYWWEWTHRFLGRLVGAVFAIPFAVFLVRGMPQRLIWRCGVLLVLGGLQGAVGWWMVASGLADRVSVAPERLAVHLGLALVLFCALVWTGLEAWFGQARGSGEGRWPGYALGLLALAFVQSLLGALVAGNDGGLVFNDWPLMNGAFLPDDYGHHALWDTLAHSQGPAQFHHRMGAYLLLACVIGVAAAALRSPRLAAPVRGLTLILAVLVVLQAVLGIVTLMTLVPLPLALAHQFGAILVLASATALTWRANRQ